MIPEKDIWSLRTDSSLPNPLGIADRFQLEAMLESRHTVTRRCRPTSDDEDIVAVSCVRTALQSMSTMHLRGVDISARACRADHFDL